MSRITGVIVALATTAAVLTGSTVGAEPAPAGSRRRRELPHGHPRRRRAGAGRRRPAAGVGGGRPPRGLLPSARRGDRGVGAAHSRCCAGRTSSAGRSRAAPPTARSPLLAQCDEGGYYEDTGARLVAGAVVARRRHLVVVHARRRGLRGARHLPRRPERRLAAAPALHHAHRGAGSPSTRSGPTARSTPSRRRSPTPRRSRSCTAPARVAASRLVVQTRIGDAAPTRQEVRVALRVRRRRPRQRRLRHRLARRPAAHPRSAQSSPAPDAASPWALTRDRARASAPGLDQLAARLDRRLLHRARTPAPRPRLQRGRRVLAQSLRPGDPDVGPADARVRRRTSRGASWGDNWTAEPLGVIAVDLTCGGRRRRADHARRRRLAGAAGEQARRGLSPDGRYVAVPGRSRTYVISPERGVVTLPRRRSPAAATWSCPDGPDGAVLLTVAPVATAAGRRSCSTRRPTAGARCPGPRSRPPPPTAARLARRTTTCPTASTSSAGGQGYTRADRRARRRVDRAAQPATDPHTTNAPSRCGRGRSSYVVQVLSPCAP